MTIQIFNNGQTFGEIRTIINDNDTFLNQNKKDDFVENTAFNKDFGTTAGTVAEGNKIDRAFSTASATIDWANSNNQSITITANSTLTQTNLPNGQTCFLLITNGGAFTITWAGSIRWAGGEAPELTTSGTDVVAFKSDGTNIYGDYNLDFKV